MKQIQPSQSKKAHIALQLKSDSKKDFALKNKPNLKKQNKHTATKGSR